MKTTLTAKLKLHPTKEQFAALRTTQLAYRDSLNVVSQYAYEHGKMSNKVKLQEGTYDEIRTRFHLVSKRILTQHPNSLIGSEHLTDIRERTRRRKGKKASKKQRKANATFSKWSFAELHCMIAYKALLNKSMAIKVDANYTSQACPCCGYTARENRPNKGLLFVCQNCHYTLHSDLVGGRNITMRTLCIRQDWRQTGHLSIAPDVSDVEAKAARLLRYAELRWSPDTSPRDFSGGH
jgi:putative transposase